MPFFQFLQKFQRSRFRLSLIEIEVTDHSKDAFLDLLISHGKIIGRPQVGCPLVQTHPEHGLIKTRFGLNAQPFEKPLRSVLPNWHGIQKCPVNVKNRSFSH